MLEVFYYPYEDLLEKHREIIVKSDDTEDPGVRHPDSIKSILDFIRNDSYYPTITDKVTHLVFSIASRQDFLAANKRTAIVAGAYFLEINSFSQAVVGNFISEMEKYVLMVATKTINKEMLRRIINDLINDMVVSDDTKLYLANAL
ncbi:type II toxin-antitoxin system death-on-curing family toxin [Candidatus Saccharibacteria bacterium]|nr:type II toxin-antitoxin system death-on-curing family toxin [Candidatus Saccharibacteria bacterium]